MKMRTFVPLAFAGLGALAASLLVRIRNHDPAAGPAAPESRQVAGRPSSPTATPPRVAPRRSAGPGGARDSAGSGDVIASTDPTSPNYDPTTIVMTTQTMPSEILKREPRDPAFAGPREIVLRDRVVERLRKRVPFETKVDTKCYTSSCELTVQGTSDVDEMNAALEALDLSRLADSSEIGSWKDPADPRRRGLRITLLYPAALRDHAAYDEWLRQHEVHDEPMHKAP
jgi:hypothetical protein